MKIVIIATEIAPPMGGMQTWLHQLVTELEANHSVTVIGPPNANLDLKEMVSIDRLPKLTTSDPDAAAYAVLTAIERIQPDLVHLAQTGLAFLLPGLAAAGIPTVVTVHGNDLTRPWLWRTCDGHARDCAMAEFLSQATRLTAVSRFSAGLLRQIGLKQSLDVIPNAVDPWQFLPGEQCTKRTELGLPPDRPILLTISRVCPRKGHSTVVSVLPELLSCNPLYVVVGSGISEAAVGQQVRELGLSDYTRLVGEVPDHQIVSYYQAADVFVMPGQERWDELGRDCEGFGIVFLEAAACELPCVAYRTGGVEEAVADGETGILVPSGDHAGLTSVLQELLCNPERRQAMGRAGRQRVIANYTTRHFGRRWEAIYAKAAARTLEE